MTFDKINRKFIKLNSLSSSEIGKMYNVLHLKPDNYFNYCACPHDRY